MCIRDRLLGGEEKAYFEEMKQIVEVAHASGVVVKAMLEFGYITTPELKAKAAQLACEAGIDLSLIHILLIWRTSYPISVKCCRMTSLPS